MHKCSIRLNLYCRSLSSFMQARITNNFKITALCVGLQPDCEKQLGTEPVHLIQ